MINTLVGFCDLWVEYVVKSKDVYLGFYSTTNYGKESKTGNAKKLNLELPDKPILELLESKDIDYPKLLPAVKALIIEEYKTQYSGKKGEGYIKILEAYTVEDWKKFLKAIDWKLGELDEKEAQAMVLEKLKRCKHYNHTCFGFEESILRNIMDLLDERQCATDLLGKLVSAADVELLFRQVANTPASPKEDDPIYKIWNQLPAPTDKRNIIDKIKAVNPHPGHKKVSFYARKTAGSRIIQEDKVNDKSFLSLRYRIYEKCEKELEDYLNNLQATLSSDDEVDKLFKHLYDVAKLYVSHMSTDFKYSLTSDPIR